MAYAQSSCERQRSLRITPNNFFVAASASERAFHITPNDVFVAASVSEWTH